MWKLLAFFALSLPAVVSAQSAGDFHPALMQYFNFTEDQIVRIRDLNRQFIQFQVEKFQREGQVHRELAEERAKEIPDPLALGLRHLELEAIRRELERERTKTVERIQEVLTAVQKEKLAALEAALKLHPTACAAVNQHLMPMPAVDPVIQWFELDRYRQTSGTAIGQICPAPVISFLVPAP